MRNAYEVLREKEAYALQLRMEIAALKVVIPILVEESDIKAAQEERKPE